MRVRGRQIALAYYRRISFESRMSVRARKIALAFYRRRKDISEASGSKRERLRMPPVERDNKELMRSEKLGEEILPGINNEITLTHIIPKLSWRSLLVLSSVCRDWKRALRSGPRNYHQRVRSYSMEKLAVVDVTVPDDQSSAIALYSVPDKRFYYVPPVPGFKGFPSSYRCVAVDGKLYVLGGITDSRPVLVCKEVYVLDLLGKRRWRQCESMRKPRHEFGCAVMDGKIYVFGGKNARNEPVAGAEVYDPTLDSWSPIPYSGVGRFKHRVSVVGEELALHGGIDDEFLDDGMVGVDESSSLLEFYNPVTTEYRVFDILNFRGMDIVSGAQGIFDSVRWEDMCAYAVDEHGTYDGVHLRSFSGELVLRIHRPPLHGNEDPIARLDIGKPFTVTAVGGELLAVVHWIDTQTWIKGSYLVRSRGYSTESSQMSWEEAPCSGRHRAPVVNSIKCSIML